MIMIMVIIIIIMLISECQDMLQQIEEETRIFEEKKQLINSVRIFNSNKISTTTIL